MHRHKPQLEQLWLVVEHPPRPTHTTFLKAKDGPGLSGQRAQETGSPLFRGKGAGYRQGLLCRLLLLRERVVRASVALGRFWLLFTATALQSRAEDPRARRPRNRGQRRAKEIRAHTR